MVENEKSPRQLAGQETGRTTEQDIIQATGQETVAKLEAQLPPLELLSDLADLYKMFGDSTRLQILSALRIQELCVGDLADLLKMSASAISHQLRTLRAQNLVTYRRDGKMSYYSLADEHVEIIIDMGLQHIQEE